MVRVIVENPTNLKVHFSWSKKAMINVLSLAKMSVGAKQDAYVQLIKALQTIVELGVIKVDIEDAQTRGSFPFRQDSGESISKQPSEVGPRHHVTALQYNNLCIIITSLLNIYYYRIFLYYLTPNSNKATTLTPKCLARKKK